MRFRNQRVYKIIYRIEVPTLEPVIQVYGPDYQDKSILKKQLKLLNLMYDSLDPFRVRDFIKSFLSDDTPEEAFMWKDYGFSDREQDYICDNDIFVEGSTVDSRKLFWQFGREVFYLKPFSNGKMFDVIVLHR